MKKTEYGKKHKTSFVLYTALAMEVALVCISAH